MEGNTIIHSTLSGREKDLLRVRTAQQQGRVHMPREGAGPTVEDRTGREGKGELRKEN